MVSREGGLFPPPPLTSMVGHFGRSVLVSIHIRAVSFLVRQCLHYTEELYVSTQKAVRYTVNTIRYVTLQFTEPRSADSLSQRNRVEITVLMCEQNPCLVWLLWRRKSFPVYCEHCLSFSISPLLSKTWKASLISRIWSGVNFTDFKISSSYFDVRCR